MLTGSTKLRQKLILLAVDYCYLLLRLLTGKFRILISFLLLGKSRGMGAVWGAFDAGASFKVL